jgi:hypothetical protein
MANNIDDLARNDEGATTDEHPVTAGGNRRDLLRKLALAGAGAAAGSAILANRADAAVTPVSTEQDNPAGAVTSISYSGTTALADPGASLLTGAEKLPGTTATDGLNIFRAAVGGYGVSLVKHGVHGSTKAVDGFGVVAANAAPATDETKPAPRALAVGARGSQIQFLTPSDMAKAGGNTSPTAVIGPSGGLHSPGELYADDDFNLWFSVPAGPLPDDGVAWVRLAGQTTAGSFVVLPSPVRVYDSRSGQGPASTTDGPIVSGAERTINLKQGYVGTSTTKVNAVPVAATAAALNLTIAGTTAQGFLSLFSSAVPFPGTSNINWQGTGIDLANYVVSAVGVVNPTTPATAAAAVKVHAGGGGTTNFVIDVTGYYL